MSTINSLIMPSTIPDQATIRQLLLFSNSVCQFAPSEDSVCSDEFVDSYTHYAPVPFADGLITFQKFIKDLTSYRAEYYSGALSRLSSDLAADVDESCVWQLIDKLAQSTPSDPQPDKLMHARLLLKLAEIHHNEDNEINAALAAVNSKMSTLMSDLRDEDEEQITVQSPSNAETNHVKNPLQLLKAWCHLFLADTADRTYSIIATDTETLTTLYEYGSELISPQQKTVCTIAIPSLLFSIDQETFAKQLKKFHHTKQSEIKQFQAALLGAAEGKTLDDTSATKLNKATEETFGSAQEGHAITFHTVPLSLPQLAARITNKPIEIIARNHQPYTLVAVSA
nr:hypothetical protein [Desulfobulbaceae bacterium]